MDAVYLLVALAAVFASAAIPHLLVTLATGGARAHLWFGLGCLAAAGATLACCVTETSTVATLLAAGRASIALSTGWLVAMTWFTVEFAVQDARGRRAATVVTALFVATLIGQLVLLPAGNTAGSVAVRTAAPLFGVLAAVGLGALVALGTRRLWRKHERSRAVALGAGMGAALVTFGWHYATADIAASRVPFPPPYGLLPLVLFMTFEQARAVARLHALLNIERIGQAHVSRLAVVGELTASLAHEINQPLGAILSNADAGELMLERSDPALEEVRQILGDIRRDAVRAGNVIRSVRTLVRNQAFEAEKLDANVVVNEVLGLTVADARARGIGLEYLPAPNAAWVRGDRTRLEQVLLNLLLNAMDATEAANAMEGPAAGWRPIVMQVVRANRGEVEIHVIDEGTGIPPELLDNLFDSFHTSKAHGMGLGLSIARSLVEAHGGSIAAVNNARGGATVIVTLPPFLP